PSRSIQREPSSMIGDFIRRLFPVFGAGSSLAGVRGGEGAGTDRDLGARREMALERGDRPDARLLGSKRPCYSFLLICLLPSLSADKSLHAFDPARSAGCSGPFDRE